MGRSINTINLVSLEKWRPSNRALFSVQAAVKRLPGPLQTKLSNRPREIIRASSGLVTYFLMRKYVFVFFKLKKLWSYWCWFKNRELHFTKGLFQEKEKKKTMICVKLWHLLPFLFEEPVLKHDGVGWGGRMQLSITFFAIFFILYTFLLFFMWCYFNASTKIKHVRRRVEGRNCAQLHSQGVDLLIALWFQAVGDVPIWTIATNWSTPK